MAMASASSNTNNIQDFPPPRTFVADPNGFLSVDSKASLEERVRLANSVPVTCNKKDCGVVPLQVAVAIAESIDAAGAVDAHDVDVIVETFDTGLVDLQVQCKTTS